MPESCTTWEDYYVLKSRYPDVVLWESKVQNRVSGEGEAIVIPSPSMVDNESRDELASSLGPASEKTKSKINVFACA
jgi:hypothetical protein